MSRNITIATPNERNYMKNQTLYRILAYLGRRYKENHTGIRVQQQSDYKVGLDFINRKCGKWYKTAIKNLIVSRQKRTVYKTNYQNWKFHKKKAERFFRVLHQELKRTEESGELWYLFSNTYAEVYDSFPIEKCGSHIISYPYRSALNQAISGSLYTCKEKNIIDRIEKTFPPFDDFYRE